MKTFEKAFKILKILNSYGESYIVGGSVRDYLLNLSISDFDITTNVPINIIESLFKTYDIGKNKDFGVVCVNFENENFEIAQFRTESDYLDGRHPSKVNFVKSIEEDLSRRDFTINAMAMNLNGIIIDPFNGQKDIENKIIRTVNDPFKRINEDFLRMLRAIRFSNKFDFQIEEQTWNAIYLNAENIQKISKERIHQEIWKMASFSGKKFFKCIEDLLNSNLLQYIYPELFNLQNMKHSPIHHPESPNVLGHILKSIEVYEGRNPFVNFAILFHDIGKLNTYTYNEEKNKIHYIGHDFEGYILTKELAKKYCWNNELRDIVAFCCKEHMKFMHLNKMRNSKILKLMNSKFWHVLFFVAKADTFSRGIELGEKDWGIEIKKLESLLLKGLTVEYYNHVKEKINGDYIMKIRKIKNPCKEIGCILEKTIDYIIDHNISLNNDEKIEHYVKSYYYNEKSKPCLKN